MEAWVAAKNPQIQPIMEHESDFSPMKAKQVEAIFKGIDLLGDSVAVELRENLIHVGLRPPDYIEFSENIDDRFDAALPLLKKVLLSYNKFERSKPPPEFRQLLTFIQQIEKLKKEKRWSPDTVVEVNLDDVEVSEEYVDEKIKVAIRNGQVGYLPDVKLKQIGASPIYEVVEDYAYKVDYQAIKRTISFEEKEKLSIDPKSPQTWNRYTYCYNNPLTLIDENGKWPTERHNQIIATAFDRMTPARVAAVQAGSRSVDISGGDVKTMKERNAPQHAMTPGTWVKEMGLEKAQSRARGEAVAFVESNLATAKEIYDGRNRRGLNPAESELGALRHFGQAMHTVMDNRSPSHTGFQVFYGPSAANIGMGAAIGGAVAGPIGAIVGGAVGAGAISEAQHIQQESRPPTADEMNLMVDEMRMDYQKTFGKEAYERDVSEEQRNETERRMAQRRHEDMLAQ